MGQKKNWYIPSELWSFAGARLIFLVSSLKEVGTVQGDAWRWDDGTMGFARWCWKTMGHDDFTQVNGGFIDIYHDL